ERRVSRRIPLGPARAIARRARSPGGSRPIYAGGEQCSSCPKGYRIKVKKLLSFSAPCCRSGQRKVAREKSFEPPCPRRRISWRTNSATAANHSIPLLE